MNLPTLLADVESEAAARNNEVLALVCQPFRKMMRVRFVRYTWVQVREGDNKWEAELYNGYEYVGDLQQLPTRSNLHIRHKVIHGHLCGKYEGTVINFYNDAVEISNAIPIMQWPHDVPMPNDVR